MEQLAALAEYYGTAEIRLTTSQNAIIPDVPADRLQNLLREPLLQIFSPNPAPFMRGMVACTGSDYCTLAQIQTKKLALEVSAALERRFGIDATPLTINWSGCVAGCGSHLASDIGFRGMKVNVGDRIIEAVAIYAGGRTGPDAIAGEQVMDVVPCDDALADVVADVMLKRGLVQDTSLQSTSPDFVPIEMLTSLTPDLPSPSSFEFSENTWPLSPTGLNTPTSLGGD
jgi:ferredoxin-nitrite reductase